MSREPLRAVGAACLERAHPRAGGHGWVALFPQTCCARAIGLACGRPTGERGALAGTCSAGGRLEWGRAQSEPGPAGRRTRRACRPRSARADPRADVKWSACVQDGPRGVTPASRTRVHTWVRAVGEAGGTVPEGLWFPQSRAPRVLLFGASYIAWDEAFLIS